ncbi:MAG: DUF2378 family protein [Archangiaceae bacterium]|nr:DUF2378 family protein [Archangiaceae bacterium]
MSPDPESLLPVVHRDLVEALEGEASGAGIGSGEWRDKVSRAIAASAEGPRKVGYALGQRYSQSVVGRALMVSLELVPAERVWSTLVPVISARLRRDVKVQWRPVSAGVGRLVISGPRATPPGVTHGVFDFFAEHTQPRSHVEFVDCTETQLIFECRWG